MTAPLVSPSSACWEQALASYEAALINQLAVLHGTASPAPQFQPPEALGPLPPHLAERARALVERTAEIGDSLNAAADQVRSQLDGPRPSEERMGAFLDTRD